jgi:ATP-binding cassette subfamily B protein
VQGLIAGRLVDALGGARTIAAAGTAELEARRVLGPVPELHRQGVAMWHTQMRITTQDLVLVSLLEIAVLAVAGALLARGQISPGELIAASQYVLLASGIGGAVTGMTRLVRSRAAATRVAEILDQPPLGYGTASAPSGHGRIEFHGVTARAGGQAVLSGVDLVIPAGALVAVVGRGGSGKSLLAALAGRLVDPDEGEVLLDGLALPKLSRRALRREIGYGFERPVLIGETLADAIAWGTNTASPDEVVAAAGAARADDFIRRMPTGYDTRLADAPMSGGEIQRVGLARTFAHARRVVVLDDIAASLDTVTEHHISAVLTGALADRTRIVIAHRASTAARADTVIWLENGGMRAYASHEQLWHDPAYRALFEAEHEPDAAVVATTANGGPA